MKRFLILFILPTSILVFSGCAKLTEFSKILWGSSTKRLEIERERAISRSFACQYDDCFDAVLKMCSKEYLWTLEDWDYDTEELEELQEKEAQNKSDTDAFLLHLENREKRHIVVVNVPGNVDTTEVGIFFEPTPDKVKIELSSLSTKAKKKAAEIVFGQLSKQFQEIEHD